MMKPSAKGAVDANPLGTTLSPEKPFKARLRLIAEAQQKINRPKPEIYLQKVRNELD